MNTRRKSDFRRGLDSDPLTSPTVVESCLAHQHRSAAKVVAALAVSVDDCVELLAMLGLEAGSVGPDAELSVSRDLRTQTWVRAK
jgi:hypothetical protein